MDRMDLIALVGYVMCVALYLRGFFSGYRKGFLKGRANGHELGFDYAMDVVKRHFEVDPKILRDVFEKELRKLDELDQPIASVDKGRS